MSVQSRDPHGIGGKDSLPFANASTISESLSRSLTFSNTSPSLLNVPDGTVSCHGSLRCCLLNARSVMSKKLDIQALLVAECLDVLAVTETFLGDEILDSELVSSDYTIFRRDRNRHGGGVMVYTKSSVSATRRTDIETTCEVLWVELSTRTSKVLLGTFYRPPSSTPEYLTQLELSLACIPESYTVILCEDFNVHVNWSVPSPYSPSRVASVMCDIAQDFSLQQLVPEPTRGAHTLDLLLTNNPDRISNVKVVDGLPGADHEAVDFVVELAPPRSSAERRIVYDFKRADFEMFRDRLSAIPWTSYIWGVSIEDSWQRFKDLLFAAADECIPKVTLRKRKKKTWLSDETLRMVRRKRRAHRVMKRSGRSGDLRRYRILSNAVRDLTRNDHRLYLEEITKDYHTSQKPFWRWLKNMRGSPRTIPDLNHQGQTLSSLAEKVKAFHAYFLSVFTREDTRNLEPLCRELEFSRSTEHVEDMSFSEDEVYNALCLTDPSKACGPDCVPGRLLKEGAPWLSDPLVALFNLSLKTGELPSD